MRLGARILSRSRNGRSGGQLLDSSVTADQPRKHLGSCCSRMAGLSGSHMLFTTRFGTRELATILTGDNLCIFLRWTALILG